MSLKPILINDDCLNHLKKLPNSSIDLTVTSPPYDGLRTYNGNNYYWCDKVWKKLFKELYKKTKQGGVVVWVVGDSTVKGSETGTSFKQALYAKKVGFNLHDTMIYYKDNPPPVGGNNRYYQSFEYMFIFSKGTPNTFNPIVTKRRNKWKDKRTVRVRPVTRNKSGVFTKKEIKVNRGNVKLQNVWSYVVSFGSVSTNPKAHKHPAIFPESLVRDHIISWSNKGDIVLDPFMGSGTTGVVCKRLERNFIGIELDKKYFKLAKKRIRED